MEIFGLQITRANQTKTLSGVDSRGGMSSWFRVLESFSGAWQTNTEVELTNVLTYAPVYACVRLISEDIGKLRLRLMKQTPSMMWEETENPAFSPVLRKPNSFQTRIDFIECWVTSRLIHGNAYILKQRDGRGVVRALYVLDPTRVTPMVADDGSVFYQLQPDNLSRIPDAVMAPASEIIHDAGPKLYHPLVGISPISACGVASVQALRIQESSAEFFGNRSQPGGVLTAPGNPSKDTLDRIKDYWATNFTGSNAGNVAVLGDGMKYEQMSVNAHDAQLIEQLKWTAEDVCIAFGMPPYKINVGPPPNYNNIEALDLQYYSQCLQSRIEKIELLLDEGLGLAPESINGVRYGTEFDITDLARMDTAGRVDAATKAINAGMSVNEVRARYFDLGPVTAGDDVLMQHQNWPIWQLAAKDREIGPAAAAQPAPQPEPDEPTDDEPEDKALSVGDAFYVVGKAIEIGGWANA